VWKEKIYKGGIKNMEEQIRIHTIKLGCGCYIEKKELPTGLMLAGANVIFACSKRHEWELKKIGHVSVQCDACEQGNNPVIPLGWHHVIQWCTYSEHCKGDCSECVRNGKANIFKQSNVNY